MAEISRPLFPSVRFSIVAPFCESRNPTRRMGPEMTTSTHGQNPTTSTGTELEVVLPLPSCPLSLLPQHMTAPP